MNTKHKFELVPDWHYESSDRSSNIVHYANFAERWYRNIKLEAAGTNGRKSTRKEIIAAASFLETYIFEWARALAFNSVRVRCYVPDVRLHAPFDAHLGRFSPGIVTEWSPRGGLISSISNRSVSSNASRLDPSRGRTSRRAIRASF